MAEFTLRVTYRGFAWKGAFDGAPSATVTCYPDTLAHKPTLDIRYDSDPTTPVANTILTDAHVDFGRVLTVEM